ncbi:NHL repeat-containing protein [Streptomyces sp. C10]|uniref:NHL repeat-containing protein n=1 Tax=Streptomyces sp. C10 TaxID=531941 RepID=UPI0039802547
MHKKKTARTLRLDAQWGVTTLEDTCSSPLIFPFYAQWIPERGTCLVTDRRLPDNRVIEVDREGQVIWSFERAPRMNCAHRCSDGVLLYTHDRSLWAMDLAGRSTVRCRLPIESPVNCASVRGGRVAMGANEGVFLYTADGRLLRHYPPGEGTFIEPCDVELLASGNILVMDVVSACAVELDSEGQRVQTFGIRGVPGRVDGELSGPYSACRLSNGNTVVADWRTHRLVEYDPIGTFLRVLPGNGRARPLGPAFVRESNPGELIVAETLGRRVMVRTTDGDVLWEYGPKSLPEPSLTFPRMAHPHSDRIIVCDSFANRIVEIGTDGVEHWAFADGLSLPRSALRRSTGETVIADGLNSRVLVLDESGRLCREVCAVRSNGKMVRLRDPHCAELTDTGHLLVVDSDLQRVFLLDTNDSVVAQWGNAGDRLADPHQADLLPDGGILVADSGHDRMVRFDRDGRIQQELTGTYDSKGGFRSLKYPRCGQLYRNGDWLVVDTDACRIVGTDRAGREKWSLGPIIDASKIPAASPELRVPKWAAFDSQGRLLVTDHYNSRVARFCFT